MLAAPPPPPLGCPVPHDASTFTISGLLAVGIFLSSLPQHYRIIALKSSLGISPAFVLLGVAGAWSNLLNIVILQWDVIRCCGASSTGAWGCLEGVMGVVQLAVQYAHLLLLMLLFTAYYPPRLRYTSISVEGTRVPTREWLEAVSAVKLAIAYHVVTLLLVVYLSTPHASSHPTTPEVIVLRLRALAAGLGIVAACIAVTQYIPQLLKTYATKHPSAVSIPMMAIQTPGGALLAFSLFLRDGVNLSTYLSYIIAATMQGTLLVMCIVYRRRERLVVRERVDGRVTPVGAYWEDSEAGDALLTDDDDILGLARSGSERRFDSDMEEIEDPAAVWSDDDEDATGKMRASEVGGVIVSPLGSFVQQPLQPQQQSYSETPVRRESLSSIPPRSSLSRPRN